MWCCPYARWLAAVSGCIGAAALVFAVATRNASESSDDKGSSAAKDDSLRPGAMFGGTIHRNMANPVEKNIPAEWNIQEGQQKNIKWVAKLST